MGGGKRTVILPPQLAFGDAGVGCDEGRCYIPPKSTVSYIITVNSIKKRAKLSPTSVNLATSMFDMAICCAALVGLLMGTGVTLAVSSSTRARLQHSVLV